MPLRDAQRPEAIAEAAARLAGGGLVAFPTETVYGLGARADDDLAVAAIFAAKGRPAGHPLIVHVLDAAGARRFAPAPGPAAERLMARFWPGPLTVILPRSPGIATAAAGGHATIGLRATSHPVARALLAQAAALGVPGVAAPSANRFGRVSPTTAAHVQQEFGDALLVLDGGACPVGIESTIVDCSRAVPALLRPGSITRQALQAALGGALAEADAASPRTPGRLASHYAPAARVRLFDAAALAAAWDGLAPAARQAVAVYSRTGPASVRWHRALPADAAMAARELFAVLRAFDDAGVQQIWVETPPAGAEWEGVRDRLQRAAA